LDVALAVGFEGEIFDDGAGKGRLGAARNEISLKAGHDVPHPMFDFKRMLGFKGCV
jgi:hypothetical protein